jgi:multidrug resistance efflux pump
MSEQNPQPEPPYTQGEFEEIQFDEESWHARRRQYVIFTASIAILACVVMAIPFRDHVKASGRVAPQRWAQVRSEVPGVVHEARHTNGDVVQEGAVIAVLDFDEQRDAVEAARLALPRERQKLADLELRQRENAIQREGADAVAKSAGDQDAGAQHTDGSRLVALDSLADAALKGVRGFATGVRAEISKHRSTAPDASLEQAEFKGEDQYRDANGAMARYSERVAAIAGQLAKVAGADAGRQFNFEFDDLRFAYDLVDHSMEEILMKHQLLEQGFLAAVALRAPCVELERETMELTHRFRELSASARAVLGSPDEQNERLRSAEENRRLLASESQRLEAERAGVASEIAAAELAVRSAERHEGKTLIRAPIQGTLAGTSLARFDPVSANASLGVVEDASRLVLKVQVDEADFRRIKIGQTVDARATDGRAVRGTVVWRTPVAGQTVRDQEWNVLIQLLGDNSGLELGDKVVASIDVGRRSLFRRWFEPAGEVATRLRVAAVGDPTELRKSPGVTPDFVAAIHEQESNHSPTVNAGVR